MDYVTCMYVLDGHDIDLSVVPPALLVEWNYLNREGTISYDGGTTTLHDARWSVVCFGTAGSRR